MVSIIICYFFSVSEYINSVNDINVANLSVSKYINSTSSMNDVNHNMFHYQSQSILILLVA